MSLVERTKNIDTPIPKMLLESRSMPIEPVDAKSDKEVSDYMLDLYQIADECTENLSKIRDIVSKEYGMDINISN